MILVLSDTHNRIPLYYQQIEMWCKEVECIFHLGDTVGDAKWLQRAFDVPVYCVRGNNDLDGTIPAEDTITLHGKKILYMHGHLRDVGYSLERLYKLVDENNLDYVFYGHTHIPKIEHYHGAVLLNPGSLGVGRGEHRATAATVDLVHGLPYICVV